MKKLMISLVFTVSIVCFAKGLPLRITTPIPQERILEIAKMLSAKPVADGAPASDRVHWDKIAKSKKGKELIKAAELALSEKYPDCPDEVYLECSRNGNRVNYQKLYIKRITILSGLLVGECIENKGRFIEKIIEGVNLICDERSWVMPAHDLKLTNFNKTYLYIDLGSSNRALLLSYVSNWLDDKLPQEVKDRIYAECKKRVFDPYERTNSDPADPQKRIGQWWYDSKNNWNSVCHCNVVRAALAIEKDVMMRAKFIAAAERAVPYALLGYTDDGYCSEGIGYWNYGYGHHMQLALSVRNATGGKVDFCADPKTKKIMEYGYFNQPEPGCGLNFADGGGNPSPTTQAFGTLVWPEIYDSRTEALPLTSGSVAEFSLRAFGQVKESNRKGGFDTLPPTTWFNNAQVLVSRGTDKESAMRLVLAAKGGHNAELHNHNDIGAYNIYLNGKIMAGDPKGEIYTRRTFSKDRYVSKVLNSYGHPVPMVAGKLQSPGRKFEAQIVSTSFTPEKDVLVVDLTKAYEAPELKSLIRTFTYDKKAMKISIKDEVEMTTPSDFNTPIITTHCAVEKVACDASKLIFKQTVRKDTYTVKVDIDTNGSSWKLDEEIIENPGVANVKRLGISLKEKCLKASITVSYSL
jgi:hypothetical protein